MGHNADMTEVLIVLFNIVFFGVLITLAVSGFIKDRRSKREFKKEEKYIRQDLKSLGIHSKIEYENYEARVLSRALQPLSEIELHIDDLQCICITLGYCAFSNNCLFISLGIQSDADCKVEPIHFVTEFQKSNERAGYLKLIDSFYDKDRHTVISNDDIRAFQRHINLLKKWEKANFKLGEYRVIPEKDIAYYKVIGSKQYISHVHGGGASIGKAILGGVIAGDAGAIVGSRIGTEVKTEITEKDNRRIFIYFKSYGEIVAEEIRTKNIDEVLDILRAWMPQKDYEYVSLLGLNNSFNSNVYSIDQSHASNSSINNTDLTSMSDSGMLQEYKELQQLGVISREEYEHKRRSLQI